jgi:hypothetical protein
MQPRLNALAIFAFYLLPLTYSFSQVPLRWTADLSRPASADWACYQGETLHLEPLFSSYGAALPLDGAALTLYLQTNGMGASWWQLPASAVTSETGRARAVFAPSADVGAAAYSYSIRAEYAAGSSYRAFGTLTMRASPGFSPASAPAPSYWPTLAADVLQLLVPSLPTYGAWTNEAAARASADAALNLRIDGIAESGTGSASAAMSGSALRLVSADSNWWVSVLGGTATLLRVTWTNAPSDAALVMWDSAMSPTYGAVTLTRAGSRWEAYGQDDIYWYVGDIYAEGYYRAAAYNTESDTPHYYSLVPYDTTTWPKSYAQPGARTGWVDRVIAAVSSTNTVGTYVTSAALAAALAGFNPAAATNALAVASNAFALAQAAATRAQLDAATNALVRLYFVSTNAWIGVDYSNATVSVSMLSTNGATNTVTVGAAEAGIDPEATNLLWQALNSGLSGLNSGLAGKADKAWGKYAPDGAANPDPAYMTFLNAPATWFASGCSWATSGAYAVLTTPGAVAFESGGDGALRIGPDGTNWFGYITGGSVIVGAVPESFTVYDGGTQFGSASITYDYDGGAMPSLWFAPSLEVGFTLLEPGSVFWTDNLNGTATVHAPALSPAGFYKATTLATFSSVFTTTMPARFSGGVFGATNATPVIYDSTVTITSGGHTYRIPAQLAD